MTLIANIIYLKEVFMTNFESFLKSNGAKKFFALVLLAGIFYIFRDMVDLFLFIFIFSYAFYSLHDFIYKRINRVVKVKSGIVALGIYLVLILLIVLFCVKYIPILIKQVIDITKDISNFDMSKFQEKLDPRIVNLFKGIDFKSIDIKKYISSTGNSVVETMTSVGKIGLNVVLSFILSIFFILEKDELKQFARRIERSKVSYLYDTYKYFTKHFVESFGKVLKTQLVSASINGVLSTVMLAIMGFPSVLGLGFMIFIFGLIPVFGVIISLIPLSIIAFKIGGFAKILNVIIMIIILHCMESYVINPKLMSTTTKLPVFITFMVLIISEHFMGVWGLLFGIPTFMFLLNLMGVEEGAVKKTIAK